MVNLKILSQIFQCIVKAVHTIHFRYSAAEELIEEVGGVKKAGTTYHNEIMYWSGYTYRYWHYYTGESSKEMYAIANAERMATVYPGFHTLDVKMAIDRLKGK